MLNSKTAIFGGSFDPPHLGHLNIIAHLCKTFNRVIVVPSFVSPFKQGTSITSPKHRLNMLRIAQKEQGLNAEICEYEINRQGVSYSIDTLRHLAPKSGEMYFVLGSEELRTLEKWKKIDEIKSIAGFYAVERGNLPVSKGIIKAHFVAPNVSSSLVKAALALDRTFGFNHSAALLTASVHEYINQNGLYADYNSHAAALKKYGLDNERAEHTYFTTKYAVNLAKIHGISENKAIVAAMLHDIGKNVPNDSKYTFLPPKCRHAFIGFDIAKNDLKIEDEDILNAIKYHTTCRKEMSALEKIVALADKLEESRDFKGVDIIRKLAQRDLDCAIEEMLNQTLVLLKNQNREVCNLSKEAHEYYKEKINGH